MDLDQPIDLGPGNLPSDSSGTPIAYLEQIRARGDLVAVDSFDGLEILIKFPLSAGWREKLEIEGFARLRQPQEGKHHAIVSRPSGRKGGSTRPGKRKADPAAPTMLPYPEEDPVGRKLGYEGAGIMAYQTRDQMHPPLVDSAELWSDAERWPEASREHVRAAARLLGLQRGERVLDIGCGICGPARLLVDEFGVEIYGVANAEHMLATAREINDRESRWRDAIEIEFHDCQQPYSRDGFDAAWSMNMIYRVPDKEALMANAATALAPGGRLMLEDWMFTEKADAGDRETMDHHYYGAATATIAEIEEMLAATGFTVVQSEDLGHVGRTHMADFCLPQFNEVVRPRLEADFPAKPRSGRQMADEWEEATAAQIELYLKGKLTYRRYVVVMP